MNHSTVTKTTKKNTRRRGGLTLPIVVLCLFVIFIIVGVGSSAWNIHLKFDSEQEATFTTEVNENSLLLRYINPETTQRVEVVGADGKSATYPAFTYDKKEHSPKLQPNVIDETSAGTPARDLPIEWFDVTFTKLANPNPSAKTFDAFDSWEYLSSEQSMTGVPFSAGIYRFAITPNEKAGEYADNLGSASMIFVILPRDAEVWIVSDSSIYGDSHNPDIIFEGERAFLDSDFTDLKDEHTLLSFKLKESVASASDDDGWMTSLEKTAPAGDYDIQAEDTSSNYRITYKKGKKESESGRIVEATESDAVIYEIEKREIFIEFNKENKISKIYSEKVDENLFYQQLVVKDSDGRVVFEFKNDIFSNSLWNTEGLTWFEAITSVIRLTSNVSETSDAKDYDVIPSLENENYEILSDGLDLRGVFTVLPLVVEIEWSEVVEFDYDGNPHIPTAIVTNLKFEDECFIILSGEQIDVGEYKAEILDLTNKNYTLPDDADVLTQNFKINPIELTVTFGELAFEYDKTAKLPTATLNGVILADLDNVSIELVLPDGVTAIKVGEYEATLVLKGEKAKNYTLSLDKIAFNINKRVLSISWSENELIYNGLEQLPRLLLLNAVEGDDVSVVVLGGQTNAGENYRAIASGLRGDDCENYSLPEIDLEKTYSIKKASLTATVLGVSIDEGDPAPLTYEIKFDGFVGDENSTVLKGTFVFDCDYDVTLGAGEYVIKLTYTASDDDNYDVTCVNGILYIVSALVKPTANDEVYVYDGTEFEYIPIGFDPTKMTISGNKQTNAGTYKVIVSISEELLSKGAKWADKTTDPIEISWTIERKVVEEPILETTFVYNGEEQSPFVEEFDRTVGTITGDVKTNAGEYVLTILLNSNHKWEDDSTGEKTYNWVIGKKDLTITAKDHTITYGELPSDAGVIYEGFVQDQNQSFLSGALKFDYSYTQGNDVGEYDIIPRGLTSDNYNIIFVNGKLTVEKGNARFSFTTPTDVYMEGDILSITLELKTPFGTLANLGNFSFENPENNVTLQKLGTFKIEIPVYYNNGEPTKSNTNVDYVLPRLTFEATNKNYNDAEIELGSIAVKPVAYNKNLGVYYGTLHKAIGGAASNQSVYLIPGSFITISETLTIPQNITLYIPYENELWDITSDDQIKSSTQIDSNATNVTNNRISQITFTEGADLIISDGASVYLGAIAGIKGIYSSYTEITLDANSSIIVDGKFYCYGYVKELNPIVSDLSRGYENQSDPERYMLISKSGYLKTVIALYDMSSGGTVTTLNSNGICPLNTFDFASFQTYVRVESGAKVDGVARGQAGTGNYINTDAPIIRSSTKEDALFYIEQGFLGLEYLSTSSFTKTATQSNIYLGGTIKFGYLKIKVNALVTIDTSSYFLPISYKLNIYALADSSVTLNYKVKLLPGSKLQVNEGATMIISSSLAIHTKSVYYDISGTNYATGKEDALFIVNGSLIMQSTGAIGGEVQTTQWNKDVATCDFTYSTTASFQVTTNEGTNNTSVKYISQGKFFDENTNTVIVAQFSPGSVIKSYGSDDCWYGAMNSVVQLNVIVTDPENAEGVRVCGYDVYQADDASGKNAVKISSISMDDSSSFNIEIGKYFKIVENDYISASFTNSPNGSTEFANDTWYLADGDYELTIVANRGYSIVITTQNVSGAGTTKYKLYTSKDNKSYSLYGEYTSTVKDVSLVAGTWFYIEFTGGMNSSLKTMEVNTTEKKKGPDSLGVNAFAFGSSNKYELTCDYEIYVTLKESSGCVVEGTMVTLADGSQKRVEDLTYDDVLLAFNHMTGRFEPSPLLVNLHAQDDAAWCRVVTLSFSDGTRIGIMSEHAFFDKDINEYVYLSESNVSDFIGHRFVNVRNNNGKFVPGENVLLSYEVEEKFVRIFSPVSGFINVVTESMLSFTEVTVRNGLTHGAINIFEFDGDLKYNEVKMNADIAKYGLYTYDDFKAYLTYEEFIGFPWAYFKVSVGQGRLTWDDILWNIEYIHKDRLEQAMKEVAQSSEDSHGADEETNPLETVVVPPSTNSSSGGSNNDDSNDDDS